MKEQTIFYPITFTAFHSQKNGQIEVSNKLIKQILVKTNNASKKDWLTKLDDDMWMYQTTFKTPQGLSHYQVIYGKACHFAYEN